MAITKTTICNEALTYLGKDTYTDIDTATAPAALRVLAIYEQTLAELLAEHHWHFATREAKLLKALIPVPEISEYAYYFDLPSDYISIIQYGFDNDNVEYESTQYRIEGGYLLSNDTDVYIKYIARISVTYLFPPFFAELFSLRLAYKLSYALVSNVGLRDELINIYNQKLSHAIGRDQREDKSMYDTSYRLDSIRRGTRYF